MWRRNGGPRSHPLCSSRRTRMRSGRRVDLRRSPAARRRDRAGSRADGQRRRRSRGRGCIAGCQRLDRQPQSPEVAAERRQDRTDRRGSRRGLGRAARRRHCCDRTVRGRFDCLRPRQRRARRRRASGESFVARFASDAVGLRSSATPSMAIRSRASNAWSPVPRRPPPQAASACRATRRAKTLHTAKVDLALDSAARVTRDGIKLPEIENRVSGRKRPFYAVSGPPGLVYPRTLDTGYHLFLREIDGQETVLIPKGLSQRGRDQQPPHGPKHIVRLAACLMDRAEVSCRQYQAFLSRMRRVDDPATRHPEDSGVDLRPRTGPKIGAPTAGTTARLPVSAGMRRTPTRAGSADGCRPKRSGNARRGGLGPRLSVGRCVSTGHAVTAARRFPLRPVAQGWREPVWNAAHEWQRARGVMTFRPALVPERLADQPAWAVPQPPTVCARRLLVSAPATLRVQFRDHADPTAKSNDIGFRVTMRWVDFATHRRPKIETWAP